MRIAHLSDLHILNLEGVRWTRYLNKRLTGLVILAGLRRQAHPVALARRLVEDVVAARVDHVVVTGDLTNLSLESELGAARDILAPLGGPERLSLIPGNHDVYTRGAERARRFEQFFAPWMWGDATPSAYPYVKRVGEVVILGFNSAVARAPLMATGVVSPDQLARLGGLREALRGTFPIALVHHNLHSRGWRKDKMHGLTNRDAFLAAASEAGVRLVLHGHSHVANRFVAEPARVTGAVSQQSGSAGMDVIGSGSSTWSSHDERHVARFNVYHIEAGRLTSVDVHRYDHAAEHFVLTVAASTTAPPTAG